MADDNYPEIILDGLAEEFAVLAEADQNNDRFSAVRAVRRMVDYGYQLIALQPHRKDPARAFVTTDDLAVSEWLSYTIRNSINKTGFAIAELMVYLLLEQGWVSTLREGETAKKVAIGRARKLQREALMLVLTTTPDWCGELVDALLDNPATLLAVDD